MDRNLLFINNLWRDSVHRFPVVDPMDESLLAHISLASPEQLEEAVDGAHRAFLHYGRAKAHERRALLHRIADQIEAKREVFARTIEREAGKPRVLSELEVTRSITTFRVAAEEAVRMNGEFLNLDFDASSAGRSGLVRRFPLGVVLAISPFNFPLNLVAHKVAPALACGCTVVLRPSRTTPLTALLLAQAVLEAKASPGILQVVPCTTEDARVLVEHALVRKISFTGSAAVGWKLRERASKKHITLELGGNAALIVDEDADLELAAKRAALGAHLYSGQVCISVQRVICHRKVLSEFREKLIRETLGLGVGHPSRTDVVVGPMIEGREADRIEAWVKEAQGEGATLLTPLLREGAIIHPVLIEGASARAKVQWEEVFGPVSTLTGFEDFEEAISIANDSRYGLQAAVFSNRMDHIMAAYEGIEAGGIIVNDYPTFRTDPMPYGGVKESGIGREGLRYAMEGMTEPRLLVMKG